MRMVPLGLVVTNIAIILCIAILFDNGFIPLAQHMLLVALLLISLFCFFFILSMLSYFKCVMRDAGPPPDCLTASQVELYAKEELIKYADRDVSDPVAEEPSESPRLVVNEEEDMNANQLAADQYTVRLEMKEQAADDPPQQLMGSDEDDSDREAPTADHPAVAEERRKRKVMHGLEVRSVPRVAKNILDAMNVGGEAKRRELARLFGDVELCPFCQVYMLQRTHHCRHCDRCVVFMSHHCCSAGQCIGFGNHKYYLLFLFYLMLSGFTACGASVIVLLNGWNFFVTLYESNLVFYWGFNITLSTSIVLLCYLVKHLHTIGCGESMVIQMKRERQQMMRERRRETSNGVFAAVPQEEEVPPQQSFSWANLTRVFGAERRFIRYLLPVSPSSSYDMAPMLRQELSDLVTTRLHSLADIVPDDPLPQ